MVHTEKGRFRDDVAQVHQSEKDDIKEKSPKPEETGRYHPESEEREKREKAHNSYVDTKHTTEKN